MTNQSGKGESSVTPKLPGLVSHPWDRPNERCIEAIELYPTRKLSRVILLNALVAPRKPMIIITMPVSLEVARGIVKSSESIVSYVGHEATARLLSELLSTEVPVNRGEYQPGAGDVAIVARLKKRLQTPQDVRDVRPEDIEFYIVVYEELEVREYSPPTMAIYTLPATF